MEADDFFFDDIPEDAPSVEDQKPAIILSGHGNTCDDPPIFRVPTGFNLHFWSAPGTTIADSYAGLIETNPERMRQHITPESYSRGDVIPNYVLSDPKNLRIQQPDNPNHLQLIPASGEAWKLNEVMDQVKMQGRGDAANPVDVHWCACRGGALEDNSRSWPAEVEVKTTWRSPDDGRALITTPPVDQTIRLDISDVLKQSGSSDDGATSLRATSAASINEANPRAMPESRTFSTKVAGIFDNVFDKHNVNCDIVPTAEDSRSYRDPNHIGAGEAIAHGYGSASVDGSHVQAKGHFDVEANAFNARGTFSDGPLQGAAEFQLGMSAQGDGVFEVDPNNGTLVTSACGTVFVGQKSSLMLSQDVNGCTFGQSINQNAGAMANGNSTVNFDPTNGSIGVGGYASALAGASVFTGASVGGAGVSAGAGVGYLVGVGGMAGGNLGIKEGKLDVGLTLGASLGIGLNLDIHFGIDFVQVGDEIHVTEIAHAFKDFGEITEDGFDRLGADLTYCAPMIANWTDVGGDAIKDFGNDVKDGLEDFGSAFRHAFRF